jgi:hypothetical protein
MQDLSEEDFLHDSKTSNLGELPGNINQLIASTSAQIMCFADHEIEEAPIYSASAERQN